MKRLYFCTSFPAWVCLIKITFFEVLTQCFKGWKKVPKPINLRYKRAFYILGFIMLNAAMVAAQSPILPNYRYLSPTYTAPSSSKVFVYSAPTQGDHVQPGYL